MKNIGIIILVAGLIITFLSLNGFVTKEKVLEVGELKISRDKKHTLDWPPYVGIVIAVVGGGILLLGKKK